MKEKNEVIYTQSFPRFADTYRFNPVTKQPEVDGRLDIVQFVQDNYVDSFSQLLNKTIDEIEDDNQSFVRVRDLDDLIDISNYIDEYKTVNNIPLETSFEDILKKVQQQNENKEIEKESEKEKEIKQEVQSQNV